MTSNAYLKRLGDPVQVDDGSLPKVSDFAVSVGEQDFGGSAATDGAATVNAKGTHVAAVHVVEESQGALKGEGEF